MQLLLCRFLFRQYIWLAEWIGWSMNEEYCTNNRKFIPKSFLMYFVSSICFAGITSITTLTVLAYERYCLIVCPFSSTHLSKTGAKIAIIFIWLYSFCVTAPPLFGWGKYINEAANIRWVFLILVSISVWTDFLVKY